MMNRKDFLKTGLAAGAFLGSAAHLPAMSQTQRPATGAGQDLEKYRFHPQHRFSNDELVIEREQPGRPHEGKVLAAIQPHSDDIPIFAGGLVASSRKMTAFKALTMGCASSVALSNKTDPSRGYRKTNGTEMLGLGKANFAS